MVDEIRLRSKCVVTPASRVRILFFLYLRVFRPLRVISAFFANTKVCHHSTAQDALERCRSDMGTCSRVGSSYLQLSFRTPIDVTRRFDSLTPRRQVLG